jgi:hypothetical protein
MSAHNASSISVGQGLAVAFVLSLAGAAALAALAALTGTGIALRVVIAALSLAYILYLLGRSGERVGRMTTVACWIALACVAWLIGLPITGYALVHVGLVWLVRSLYYYSGLLPALLDIGLGLLGAAFAAWAAQRSGSPWLAIWCFFLVQSLHVLIPSSLRDNGNTNHVADEVFARAHRTAEAAARRLSSAR